MTRWLGVLLAVLVVVTLGCGGDKPDGEGGGMKMDKTEGDGILGLSPEDQKLARAQKDCIVSGEPLGSMGTPVKVTHGGRTYFLCCESCRKPFLKNPAKYVK